MVGGGGGGGGRVGWSWQKDSQYGLQVKHMK